MAGFKESKPTNPRLGQYEIARQLGYPSSSLLRYRQVLNMISLYRSSLNIHKKRQKTTNTDSVDVERRQLSPEDTNENDKSVSKKVKKN